MKDNISSTAAMASECLLPFHEHTESIVGIVARRQGCQRDAVFPIKRRQ